MLILTRRVGENIRIGDEVSVTVLGIRGNQVRIGINAPIDVPVYREEIYAKIQEGKAHKLNSVGREPALTLAERWFPGRYLKVFATYRDFCVQPRFNR